MHGMLSSAIILIAFALVAGAGGYTALWVYRATPGAAPRSRPTITGWLSRLGALGVPVAEPEDTSADDETPRYQPHDEAAQSGSSEEAAQSGSPDEAAESGPAEETPGARVYVLHEPRLPRR